MEAPPPFNRRARPRKPCRPAPALPARPPPSLEPRPPSDGGAAPGNGAVSTQRSCDPTLPRRPRRLSQTTRRAPAAAAGTAAPGPSLGHLRTDGADCAARNPGGHGDLGRASGREPSGASGLRSGRWGGGGHDLRVEAPAARGQAGRQVPVCGLLPRAGTGVHQEMVSGMEAWGIPQTGWTPVRPLEPERTLLPA